MCSGLWLSSRDTAVGLHGALSPPAGIVLILGATAWQRRLICQELHRVDPELTPPADITADVPAWQRLQLYQQSAQPQQQPPQQGQQQPQQQEAQQQGGQADNTAADTDAAAGPGPAAAVAAPAAADQPGSDGNIGQAAAAAAGVGAPADTEQPSAATTRTSATAAAAGQRGNEAGPIAVAAVVDNCSGPKKSASSSDSKARQCSACFVTTRILVVDIMSSRIRPQQIAGQSLHRLSLVGAALSVVHLHNLWLLQAQCNCTW